MNPRRTAGRHSVGALLREVRRAAGLTQVQLASRLECGARHIADLEHGRRVVDTVELIEIARVVGVDPVDLFARAMRSRRQKT